MSINHFENLNYFKCVKRIWFINVAKMINVYMYQWEFIQFFLNYAAVLKAFISSLIMCINNDEIVKR